MVHLDTLEKMVLLENLDLRDHLVIKAVMQPSKTAVDAHHIVPLKVTKVLLVNQEILVYLAGLVQQVLLVSLVSASMVIVESLEKMVNQVMMETMVNLAFQANPEDLEILLILATLPVQMLLLSQLGRLKDHLYTAVMGVDTTEILKKKTQI